MNSNLRQSQNIETCRLVIRPYRLSDVADAAVFLCHEQTMHYIPEKFNHENDIRQFLAIKENQQKFWAVVLKETGQVIGHLSFEPFFGAHSYEIGWIFNQLYHRQAYAKEAAYALLDYGFKHMGIHRVIATCQHENIGSWSLMEALGMRREAFFKACIPFEGDWWDEYYYAILQDEWPE